MSSRAARGLPGMSNQKIVTNLWFDNNAEEAANFYVSVFGEDSAVTGITHYPQSSDNAGQVLTAEWTLRGQRFVGINGGPLFTFSEAVSLEIVCADQDEVDYFWDKLTDGGEESMCGWLKDRYGLSWQVVPEGMMELFTDSDPARVDRAWKAMMQMRKLDVATLRAAADGVAA
jgi:predicted 3-demethylubiquinone-9 3-methyltransferase (glyoxalase superfamily)